MLKKIKIILAVGMVVVTSVLAGCAVPANYRAMTVVPTPEIKKNVKLNESMSVGDVTGRKKSALSVSVNNESFKQALEASLSGYGYLADSSDKAKYKLDAVLLKIDEPMIGFNLDIKSTVLYKLIGQGMNKEYKITANGIAKMSEAFVAGDRMRLATERSMEANIKKFLGELSRL